jgi:hypothetical protein
MPIIDRSVFSARLEDRRARIEEGSLLTAGRIESRMDPLARIHQKLSLRVSVLFPEVRANATRAQMSRARSLSVSSNELCEVYHCEFRCELGKTQNKRTDMDKAPKSAQARISTPGTDSAEDYSIRTSMWIVGRLTGKSRQVVFDLDLRRRQRL